jgi:hypothetical protein
VSPPRRIVTGDYNENGYTVLLCTAGGAHVVYSAGPHPQDSQQAASVGVEVRRIRGFCIRTCREIAGERRAQYGGVTRVTREENAL